MNGKQSGTVQLITKRLLPPLCYIPVVAQLENKKPGKLAGLFILPNIRLRPVMADQAALKQRGDRCSQFIFGKTARSRLAQGRGQL